MFSITFFILCFVSVGRLSTTRAWYRLWSALFFHFAFHVGWSVIDHPGMVHVMFGIGFSLCVSCWVVGYRPPGDGICYVQHCFFIVSYVGWSVTDHPGMGCYVQHCFSLCVSCLVVGYRPPGNGVRHVQQCFSLCVRSRCGSWKVSEILGWP